MKGQQSEPKPYVFTMRAHAWKKGFFKGWGFCRPVRTRLKDACARVPACRELLSLL